MAWQSRSPGKHYYYRSIREHGRARSIYVGTGPAAEAAIAEVERRRAERSRWNQQRKHLIMQIAVGQQLTTSSSLVAYASLLLAGYRQHAHGDWRPKYVRQQH